MSATPFQLAQNDVKSISNPSRITAIGGDNGTEFNLFFPSMPPGQQWVFPFTYGFMLIIDAPMTGVAVKVDASQIPAGSLTPPVTTRVANLCAYDTEQIPSPGVFAPSGAYTNTPWAAPNQLPVFGQRVGIGTTVLIAAVAGKTLYIFGWQMAIVTAIAAGAGTLQDSAGNRLGEIRTDTIHETNGQLNGTALGIGLGLNLVVAGAAGTVDATVSYSKA